MVETVGTTTTFDMPVDEIIVQALDAIGGEHTTHEDMKRARNALNLIFIDMQNRGSTPLASLQTVSVAFVSGSAEGYSLGQDVFNVLDAVVRVSTASGQRTDIPLNRISYTSWLQIPTKYTEARPTQFLVNKQRNDTLINVWPTPDVDGKYSLYAWVVKRVADVTKNYQLVDFPHRYLPAIVNGLTYYMSRFKTEIPLEDRQMMKDEYVEALDLAMSEDREKSDFYLYPANTTQL